MAWQAHGFKAWLLQRLTAVYVGFYFILAIIYFLLNAGDITFERWLQLVSQPIVNVSLLIFFYAVLFHAWVGVRDVVMDYAKPVTLRLVLLILIALGLFIMAIWVSLILITVMQL